MPEKVADIWRFYCRFFFSGGIDQWSISNRPSGLLSKKGIKIINLLDASKIKKLFKFFFIIFMPFFIADQMVYY